VPQPAFSLMRDCAFGQGSRASYTSGQAIEGKSNIHRAQDAGGLKAVLMAAWARGRRPPPLPGREEMRRSILARPPSYAHAGSAGKRRPALERPSHKKEDAKTRPHAQEVGRLLH
jgi:hypothetical protein